MLFVIFRTESNTILSVILLWIVILVFCVPVFLSHGLFHPVRLPHYSYPLNQVQSKHHFSLIHHHRLLFCRLSILDITSLQAIQKNSFCGRCSGIRFLSYFSSLRKLRWRTSFHYYKKIGFLHKIFIELR